MIYNRGSTMKHYRCLNCGYEWNKENGGEYENCIKCGVIFVECIKEVTNDTTQICCSKE